MFQHLLANDEVERPGQIFGWVAEVKPRKVQLDPGAHGRWVQRTSLSSATSSAAGFNELKTRSVSASMTSRATGCWPRPTPAGSRSLGQASGQSEPPWDAPKPRREPYTQPTRRKPCQRIRPNRSR